VDKLPITAIVASHNEAALLPSCLAPLDFCDELIVLDIASTDDTVAVAERLGARVIRHEWVPSSELAHPRAVAEARNDWVVIRDPDEVISPALARQTRELFAELPPDVAAVAAPTQYHFGGRPLQGGAVGGVLVDRLLADRTRVEFPKVVHGKLSVATGSRSLTITFDGENAIQHYWVTGWRAYGKRSLVYLRIDGVDRANAGYTTGLRTIAGSPIRAFHESFVRRKGYRDGLLGFALSVAGASFTTAAEIGLYRELRRRARASRA
jgi:glycosyltransferase involved in cell wall biosynthesis